MRYSVGISNDFALLHHDARVTTSALDIKSDTCTEDSTFERKFPQVQLARLIDGIFLLSLTLDFSDDTV